MRTIIRCLMTTNTGGPITSLGLLLFRIAICCGLLIHGIPKLQNFETLSKTFADPISTGPFIALCLVILAEVICAGPIILGLFTRIAVLAPIIMMSVAVFVFHANDPFAVKEPALFYLCGYSLLFLVGPGRFSMDALINWRCSRKRMSHDTGEERT